jgi:RNA polymerase sigma-70 factor (ECF subfamily)
MPGENAANDQEFLARQFEQHRSHLRAVAYRMLGSFSDADDAVQETWTRLSRTDAAAIENLGGWLTTVVGRVCLNQLRSRTTRREAPLDPHVADPIITAADAPGPADEAELADSVGLALLVVLETLPPAERLAFVLHDMFAVPFDEVAAVVDRSPAAARQLASRARRRVQGQAPAAVESDPRRQREVVDAFFAAARDGDFERLVSVLDPDVVVRADLGARAGGGDVRQGAENVASGAIRFARASRSLVPVLVNGDAGAIVLTHGRPFSVMGFTIAEGRVVAIDILGDPERLAALDLGRFLPEPG